MTFGAEVFEMDEIEEEEPKTPFGPHFIEAEKFDAALMEMATAARGYYEALLTKGFTEEQALYLTGEMTKRPA